MTHTANKITEFRLSDYDYIPQIMETFYDDEIKPVEFSNTIDSQTAQYPIHPCKKNIQKLSSLNFHIMENKKDYQFSTDRKPKYSFYKPQTIFKNTAITEYILTSNIEYGVSKMYNKIDFGKRLGAKSAPYFKDQKYFSSIMNHKETHLPQHIFNNIKSYVKLPPKPTPPFPLQVGKTIVLENTHQYYYYNKVICPILKVEHIKTEKEHQRSCIGGITKTYKVKVKLDEAHRTENGEDKNP